MKIEGYSATKLESFTMMWMPMCSAAQHRVCMEYQSRIECPFAHGSKRSDCRPVTITVLERIETKDGTKSPS